MTVEFTKLSKLITYFELKKKVELEILHCKNVWTKNKSMTLVVEDFFSFKEFDDLNMILQ